MQERYNEAGEKLLPVKIIAKCVADDDTQWAHIESALERGLSEFSTGPQTDVECVLVGSGPSVAEFPEEIRAHKEAGHLIIAIKGGHDFLIEHGIIPHYALMVDPQTHIKKYFKHKQRPIKYLIASQCHPEIFDYFSDQDCILWHLYTVSVYEGAIERGLSLNMLGGGSSSGLRAVVLAYLMGYNTIHLYGFDSCVGKAGEEKISGEEPKNGQTMSVYLNEQEFICSRQMAAQANEFLQCLDILPGIKVKGYGDGLIPSIIRQGVVEGRTDCLP